VQSGFAALCIPIKETEEEGVARSAQKSGEYRDQNNGENGIAKLFEPGVSGINMA
jgi:hypothetical protein